MKKKERIKLIILSNNNCKTIKIMTEIRKVIIQTSKNQYQYVHTLQNYKTNAYFFILIIINIYGCVNGIEIKLRTHRIQTG